MISHGPEAPARGFDMLNTRTGAALGDVLRERARQERICEERDGWLTCADRFMSPGTKLAILVEEVGEVARELCEAGGNDPGPNLRVELIQVAAVAVAWAEALDKTPEVT